MKILIFGAGVVGQATGKGLMTMGHEVIFIDIQYSLVKSLKNQGYAAFHIEQLYESRPENFDHDIAMFCVSTPSRGKEGSVNIDHIESALTFYSAWLKNRAILKEQDNNNFNPYIKEEVLSHHKKIFRSGNFPLIVIRSTVPPGTTRKRFLPMVEKYSGLTAGIDFGLCMQPEFLRARSSENDFLHPRLTVIGEYNNDSGSILDSLYMPLGSPIVRVSLEEAELMKYVHNCFNATKISFINEMWLLSRRLNINPDTAFQLAARSAEGFWNPLYGTKGGQPFGGACLPKDSTGFLAFASEQGVDMPVLASVIKINELLKEMSKKGMANPAVPHSPWYTEDRPQEFHIDNYEKPLRPYFTDGTIITHDKNAPK